MNNPPNLIQQNRDGSFLKLLQNKITLEKCFEYYLNYLKKIKVYIIVKYALQKMIIMIIIIK